MAFTGTTAWRHPTTWLALLALLVALSGSAYAATKINGKNLKKHSVPGNRLKPGTVTGAEVANGSLTGAELAPGSLLQPGKVELSDLTPAARAALAETVPAGALMVGNARPYGQAVSGSDTVFVGIDTLDYGGRRMPTALIPEFVGPAKPPTAHCHGSAAAPDADPGYLCLYVVSTQAALAIAATNPGEAATVGRTYIFGTEATIVHGDGTVGRSGALLTLSPTAGNIHDAAVIWAARAAG